MGRYVGKIIPVYSNDPNRPTVERTFDIAREVCTKMILEKLPIEERQYIVEKLKEEGVLA